MIIRRQYGVGDEASGLNDYAEQQPELQRDGLTKADVANLPAHVVARNGR